MNNELTNCVKIREYNNSNTEVLMRIIATYLMIRGISFIHHEVENDGSELIILTDILTLHDLMLEAGDFISIDDGTKRHILSLLKSPNTEVLDVSYQIRIKKEIIENINLS